MDVKVYVLQHCVHNIQCVAANECVTSRSSVHDLHLGGKAALVWFGIGVLTLIWAAFRLPETKDKTYKELDILFEKRVPAWRFASPKLDVVAEAEILRAPGKLDAAEQIEDVHN